MTIRILRHVNRRTLLALSLALLSLPLVAPTPMLADESAQIDLVAQKASWPGLLDHGGGSLVLEGPGGVLRVELEAGETPDLVPMVGDQALADGLYTWELRLAPRLGKGLQRRVEGARVVGGTASGEGRILSGRLTIDKGLFVTPRYEEEAPGPVQTGGPAEKAQLILDDLVVTRNTCTGTGCISSESFGTDVLRLKDVNNRIHFWDTSAGAFPTNDWRITLNSDVSGGASFFSIDDVDGGATPFTIEAGADANALYVDDQGRLGVRTAAPAAAIHAVTGDSPTLRLDQDTSLSFAAQVWDLTGNEANFFVQDVTGGGNWPLRIRTGAPSDTILIDSDGQIGLGLDNPGTALHLRRTDGSARILVQEASATVATRSLFELRNAGATQFTINNTNAGTVWRMANNGRFTLSADGTGAFEFDLQTTGDLEIRGTLTESSDVAVKKNFATIDPLDVLARVEALPVTTWSYKDNPDTIRHMGPMAQDFHAAFGLGGSTTGIAPRNLAAVALVSVQGLVREKDAELAELREENRRLAERLERLEMSIERLVGEN